MPKTEIPFWSKTVQETIDLLETDLNKGLKSGDVENRQRRYGLNELDKEEGTPLWKLVLEQFDDMLVKVLLIAAIISFVLVFFEDNTQGYSIQQFVEPLVILVILVLNALVGIWQESRAEQALNALKQMQGESAKTYRDGRLVPDLSAKYLVPGDIVELVVGDLVPADSRVARLENALLRVEQASLTGEANAVDKYYEPSPEDCDLTSKECMLFAGTSITNGSCLAIVVQTGMQTEIGKIQAQIQEAQKQEEDTPLKKRLNEFGEQLAKIIFWICGFVWLLNYDKFIKWQNYPNTYIPNLSTLKFSLSQCTYYFKIAVALAVAAIPEGLPAVITTCLALGTRRMTKKNAIVRKLPSVETLGCTTVICSDKTGTLTTNQMSVVKLGRFEASGKLQENELEGNSYDPSEGRLLSQSSSFDKNLEYIAAISTVCNEAKIEYINNKFKCVGAPTDAAMRVLGEKIKTPDQEYNERVQTILTNSPDNYNMAISKYYAQRFKKLATFEFDRNRKSMSIICMDHHSSKNILLAKGAAEVLLERCTRVMLPSGERVRLDQHIRQQIEASISSFSKNALRCLALAIRDELPQPLTSDLNTPQAQRILKETESYIEVEQDMTFVGLVGILDPPRKEVKEAIRNCQTAGLRVCVITGDNKDTAEEICKRIGIFERDEDLSDKSFIGRKFSQLSEKDKYDILANGQNLVFARAEPKNKVEIVRIFKDLKEIVAMTGDGVNDAPAIKLANIGIAMGISGTEVAKEASDMILADDNFSSIVSAVSEGRAIYDNMKAFIRYMISSNIGEVATIFFTAFLGLPEGLIPVQLLWVNLVTDGPPATALGFNPPDIDIMERPPRKTNEQLISRWTLIRFLIIGVYVGAATVGSFVAWYMSSNFIGIDLSMDGHTTVSWQQLKHWRTCDQWHNPVQANSSVLSHLYNTPFNPQPYSVVGGGKVTFATPCDYFTTGKIKASTIQLTTLVAIEMLNSMNALSENNSIFSVPPYYNPYLILAICTSFITHALVMYIPVFAQTFSIVPLNFNEWLLVLALSAPVIAIDEVLKLYARVQEKKKLGQASIKQD